MFVAFLAAAAAVASVPKATAIDVGSWFTPEDYPPEAQKNGIEGSAVFEVDVDPQGRPTDCRITKSSGSPVLDRTTCDVVLKRARFKPAMRRGKPVAGRYSKTTSWRLEGTIAVKNGYFAAVIDYSKDRAHPSCEIVSNGIPDGPTCEQAMKGLASANIPAATEKLVLLTTMSSGDEQPYRGDPAWGRRLSFVAIDLFPARDGAKAACALVASEGIADADPCRAYGDVGPPSEEQKRSADRAHVEKSLFAVRRTAEPDGRCKNGQSAAESHGCV